MKRAVHMLFILAIVLSGFTGVLIITPSSTGEYTPHTPIFIWGNEDLAEQAAIEGWSGDGTEGNPYIIEGYEINANNDSGILIYDIAVSFIIRDIRIIVTNDRDVGIILWNVTNGIISNCILERNMCIILYFSRGITLVNNTMENGGIITYGSQLDQCSTHNIDTTNTINGKPIYYWRNRSGDVIPPGAGQVIIANCSNITIENQEFSELSPSIQLYYSSNNTIRNNNENIGTFLFNSHNNKILTNQLSSNKYYGIDLRNSNRNIISGNQISNGDYGIYIRDSINVICTNNTLSNTGLIISGDSLEQWNTHDIDTSNIVDGRPVYYWKNRKGGVIPSGAGQVFLANCSNVTVENQKLMSSSIGIKLVFSSNNTIMNNEVKSYLGPGISLYRSNENTLEDNNISDNYDGVFLRYSNSNIISGNSISDNENGIYLRDSNRNILINNYIHNNNRSIQLSNSSENKFDSNTIHKNIIAINCKVNSNKNSITNNEIFRNEDGINIEDSNEITITNNKINGIFLPDGRDYMGSSIGIYIKNSHNNTILHNSIYNNSYGIFLRSSNENHIKYNNVSNNNESGISIGWSNGNHISNNEVNSNNESGISITRCLECKISNNSASGNRNQAIRLSYGDNCTLSNNTALFNGGGLSITYSNENRIIDNDFSLNDGKGIYFYNSTENEVVNNYIFNNTYGFHIYKSSANAFHHNDIIDNTFQVRLIQARDNFWDDGNGEGNYWSDYTGFDTDGDGVGDTELPHHGVDHYPLTDRQGSVQLDWLFLGVVFVTILNITVILVIFVLKKRK